MHNESARSAVNLAGSAFREHALELHRYLLRRVRHSQDVEDLSQEVFARLLRVRDAGLVRNPLAYLLGIAMHVVREFHQRRAQEPVMFDSAMADVLCDEPRRDAAPGPAESLELTNRLDRALALLPATHQLVMLLVKRDGMSYAEAALASGLSVHTIEKYLVEGRARLRAALDER